MNSLENELESFLEATQDPAAWLMVFAANHEIKRLKELVEKMNQTGAEAWRQVDEIKAQLASRPDLQKRLTCKYKELKKSQHTLETAAYLLACTGTYSHKTYDECMDIIYKAAKGGDK